MAHEGLLFANPLAAGDVARGIDALPLQDGARVLETGCGSAEVLLRVLERHPGATGVGIDPDADWLARAAAAAQARGLGDRLDLVQATAEEAAPAPGSFDAVVNVASSHAHGGYPAALAELASLVRPGGSVLLGEGFWARPPTPGFLEALGGATEDELGTLDDLLAHAGAAGLVPIFQAVASRVDWATYEETLAANAQARGDADSLAYANRIRERRALSGGTSTLGFALLVLRAA
jgi:SAM-dependent methyltransferase